MAKRQISITIDEAILERVDRVAELRHEGRSQALERIIRMGIDSEEEFLNTMGRPVVGAALRELMKMPGFWEKMSQVVGDNVPPDMWKRMAENADMLREAGKKQRGEKKGK